MRKTLLALSAALLDAFPLAACAGEDMPEPPAITTTITSTEVIAESDEAVGVESQAPATVELAPGETALTGMLKAVHFSDMTPPDVYEQVKEAVDNESTYYAIELDPQVPVTAKGGAGMIEQHPEWAIVGVSSRAGSMDWTQYEGHRLRVIVRPDQMTYGTDISLPPLAVMIHNSDYQPEILD